MLLATMLDAFTGLGVAVACALFVMLLSVPSASSENEGRFDWTMRIRRK
jgi:hypothetical protein